MILEISIYEYAIERADDVIASLRAISSVESQKGAINIQSYSVENQKGAIAVQSIS